MSRCISPRWPARRLTLLGCLVTLAQALPAQESPPAAGEDLPSPQESPPAGLPDSDTLDAISTLTQAIQELAKNILQKRAELSGLEGEEREQLRTEIEEFQDELERLQLDRDSALTGLDINTLDSDRDAPLDLSAEVVDLLRPLVEQLKAATEEPRRIETLRRDLNYLVELEESLGDSVARIEGLLARNENARLDAVLTSELARWQKRRQDARNQVQLAQHRLDTRLQQRKSLLESTRSFASEFFATRGKNLLLAFSAFGVVLVVSRLLYYAISKSRRRGSRQRSFYSRLFRVLYTLLSLLAAALAAMAVLYAASDWLLLGVVIILLTGIAWASKQTLPAFIVQTRLLLNLGSVREGERVVLNGISWHVSSLNLYTTLTNPALTGGKIRLPVQNLVDMHSRPCASREVWFPCQENDWVELDGGIRGQVTYQSPEMVQIQRLGGSLHTYATASFLDLSPRNLSQGFRLPVTFGVDYGHQAAVTTAIPQRMEGHVRQALEQGGYREVLHGLKVEFREAAASSLDLVVLADFDGRAAPNYDTLIRLIQRSLVDLCNQEDWVIPFAQLTVHRAEG